MRDEIWKSVVGHEGSYEVSDQGRVRRVALEGPRLLRPGKASNGYFTVAVGKGNTRTVHSLVAEAFIGPRPDGMDVMHIDGSRTNNRLENLRYGTRGENSRQAFRDGRKKLTPNDVARIVFMLADGVSGAQISRQLGVSESLVSVVKHGRQYLDA